MFGKQGDVFPDDSHEKEVKYEKYKETLRAEKEKEKQRKKEEKKRRKQMEKGEVFPEEIDYPVTVSGLVEQSKNEKEPITLGTVLLGFFIGVLIVAFAFLAGYLTCYCNGRAFTLQLAWPVIVCSGVFMLSTIGYFLTSGKLEKVYGTFSILSVACFLAQLMLMF